MFLQRIEASIESLSYDLESIDTVKLGFKYQEKTND